MQRHDLQREPEPPNTRLQPHEATRPNEAQPTVPPQAPPGDRLQQDAAPTGMLASDAERAQLFDLLQRAYVEGRLTLEEFTERMDQAQAARTQGQLQVIARGLPMAGAAISTPAQQSAANRKPVTLAFAIMSDEVRKGRWVVGETCTAIPIMGNVTLDLRNAIMTSPVTTINAFVVMGKLEVIVPRGVDVEHNCIAIMGAKRHDVHDPAPPPGAPLVRINGFILMGEVTVHD